MDEDGEDLNISTSFIDICRLCFHEGQLKKITGRALKSKFLPLIIKMFEVMLKFKLPEKVCVDCLRELKQISVFIKKCKHAQSILSEIEKCCKKVTPHRDEKKINILDVHQIIPANLEKNETLSEQIVLNEDVEKEIDYFIIEDKLEDVAKVTKEVVNVTQEVINVSKNKPEEAIQETFEEVINVFQETELEEVFTCVEEVILNDDLEKIKEHSDEVINVFMNNEDIEMLNILKENTTEELSNIIIEDIPEEVVNVTIDEEKLEEVANVTAISQEIMNENELIEYMELTKQVNFIDLEEKQETEVDFIITSEDFHYDDGDIESEVPHFEITQNDVVNNETITKNQNSRSKICGNCGKTVNRLKEHYRISKNCRPKNSHCSECDKTFATKNELKSHTKAHHWNENHQYLMCHICSKHFKYQPNLKRHLLAHEKVKSFQCEKCGKAFTTKNRMMEHMNLHNGLKPYKCNYCDLRFTARTGRDSHQINKHGHSSNERNMFCEICNKQVLNQEELILHRSQKHPNPTFKCNECEELFHSTELLQVHCSKMHKKTIACRFCPKSFTRLSALNKHIKVHTGEKPYECTVCGKSFAQKAHLYNHSLLHTGEKSHPCQFCDKKFALKGNLTVHMRIHTGEKPYVCHICKQGFCDTSARKRHIVGRHGEEEVQYIQI